MPDWLVHDSIGDAGDFHATDPPPVRSATFHSVTTTTLVLGSGQRAADVDHRVADALSIDVVHRRSGGGAVLLVPGEFVWLDLVIPAHDALWAEDVGRAMLWVGELWQRALRELAIDGYVSAMSVNTTAGGGDAQWAKQVCFAGIGAGELVRGTRKVVGVSQRRTRSAARFQSLCHTRWRPELVAALVAPPRPNVVDLAASVAPFGAAAAAIREALLRHLP